MLKVAIFVDVCRIWSAIERKYPQNRLDYDLLMRRTEERGRVILAKAYGTFMGPGSEKFVGKLGAIGFDPVYGQPNSPDTILNWDASMAIDLARIAHRLDEVVICTNSDSVLPIVEFAKERGLRVVVVSCNAPASLKYASNECYEIDPSLLFEAKEEEVEVK